MQTQEILRILRLPEMGDLGQFFRSLSATTLVSMGALAAILAYWFTHRPKALTPPCNLLMQSEEVEVSTAGKSGCQKDRAEDRRLEGRSQTCGLSDLRCPQEPYSPGPWQPASTLQQPKQELLPAGPLWSLHRAPGFPASRVASLGSLMPPKLSRSSGAPTQIPSQPALGSELDIL